MVFATHFSTASGLLVVKDTVDVFASVICCHSLFEGMKGVDFGHWTCSEYFLQNRFSLLKGVSSKIWST